LAFALKLCQLAGKRLFGDVMTSEKYLLGRQPILNRDEELVAYELLFRSAGSLTADVTDATHASASVIINTLTSFGIEDILGSHKGFINMELELLMDDLLFILPKEQVVIELLETLQVTPELVERCRFLKKAALLWPLTIMSTVRSIMNCMRSLISSKLILC
jgi:c-di-GMP-related signal transduction protein